MRVVTLVLEQREEAEVLGNLVPEGFREQRAQDAAIGFGADGRGKFNAMQLAFAVKLGEEWRRGARVAVERQVVRAQRVDRDDDDVLAIEGDVPSVGRPAGGDSSRPNTPQREAHLG